MSGKENNMTFTAVFRKGGTVEQLAKRLKQNDLHRFANLPANVYHWRVFDEPVEFPENVSEYYAGIKNAHKLLYKTLLQVAPKMHNLSFCIDLDYNSYFNSVFVFDRLECVGRISYDSDGALEFCNARIDEALLRKRKIKTRALTKAVATIRKYFYGMTKVEHLSAVAARITAAISAAHSDTVYKKRNARDRVKQEIDSALFNDPQLSQAVLQYFQASNSEHVLERYHEANDTHELVEEVYRAQHHEKGLYVRAVESGFEVYRKGDTRVRTYQRDTLPDKVRGALGLLKLSSDSSFVDNVGFKFDSEMFWIMEEVANELAN
jgi:hypothetical protein